MRLPEAMPPRPQMSQVRAQTQEERRSKQRWHWSCASGLLAQV